MQYYSYPEGSWQAYIGNEKIMYVNAHCDNRLLHAPGECKYCDMYPEAQEQRTRLGINFTCEDPDPSLLPCPSGRSYEHANGWGGNVPQ